MSDDTPTPATESSEQQGAFGGDATDGGRQMVEYAQWAAFGMLVFVAFVATVRFYFAASASVETFVTRRYQPLFMMGFNLVVLLLSGIGLSVLLRRLT